MIDIKEFSTLRIGLTLFTAFIVFGVVFFAALPSKYKLAVGDVATQDYYTHSQSPYDFLKLMNIQNNDIQIVVIHDQFDSEQFLTDVIHIPAKNILEKKYTRKLKNKTNYIVSDDEMKSHAVALLLNQLGIRAVPVNTDLAFILDIDLEKMNPSIQFHSFEKKSYDYQRIMKFTDTDSEPIEIKREVSMTGGC